MSSAICFNLDQSKILSSGNGLSSKQVKGSLWFKSQDYIWSSRGRNMGLPSYQTIY